MQIFQALLEPGDEVVIPCPTWPNILEVTQIVGGRVQPVLFEHTSDGMLSLDLAKVFAAVTPRTRAIAINSPSNPTGLDHASR